MRKLTLSLCTSFALAASACGDGSGLGPASGADDYISVDFGSLGQSHEIRGALIDDPIGHGVNWGEVVLESGERQLAISAFDNPDMRPTPEALFAVTFRHYGEALSPGDYRPGSVECTSRCAGVVVVVSGSDRPTFGEWGAVDGIVVVEEASSDGIRGWFEGPLRDPGTGAITDARVEFLATAASRTDTPQL